METLVTMALSVLAGAVIGIFIGPKFFGAEHQVKQALNDMKRDL